MLFPCCGLPSEWPRRCRFARAVLAKLAENRSEQTPLGSFARTVLDRQASLREAAGQSWHGDALQQALAGATAAQRGMPAEQRAAVEREAQRLRDAGEAAHDIDRAGSDAGTGGE